MKRHRLTEDGVDDTEGQIRWRFLHEREEPPEVLAFFAQRRSPTKYQH